MLMILNSVISVGQKYQKGSTRVVDTLVDPIEDEGLRNLLVKCYETKSYRDIRCLEIYHAPRISYDTVFDHEFDAQVQAIEQSWQTKFSGNSEEALWDHITGHFGRSDIYAHFAAIVQSSGMGKSRTVDELSKTHFTIAMNLRSNDNGFPPRDKELAEFLTEGSTNTSAYNRVCFLLEALFEQTSKVILAEFPDGQKLKAPNEFRVRFYHNVIKNAKEKMKFKNGTAIESKVPVRASPGHGNFGPAEACHTLIQVLPKTSHTPALLLAFDEAHALTMPVVSGDVMWSIFSELWYSLRALKPLSCFSVFLSTTGTISQFSSSSEAAFSDRLFHHQLSLIPPFTDIGFDSIAKKLSLDHTLNLEKVTDLAHITYLGRPLFGTLYDAGDPTFQMGIRDYAANKLIMADLFHLKDLSKDQQLACLAQRIPIEFNSTHYIPLTGEVKQVEGHLRVCLQIDPEFQSMFTVSASEPLLSEAAYSIMNPASLTAHQQPSFNVPQAMKAVLEGFSIHQGERGELLAMLLLTIARDNTVSASSSSILDLAPFLCRNLFSKDNAVLQDLAHDFPNAKVHFNHFVKAHEYGLIDANRLLLLATRGAALQCANNQLAIDCINIFLHKGTMLTKSNLGLILSQMKNDRNVSVKHKDTLFASMNPYITRILKSNDPPVPIIKIIFALAATPLLEVVRKAPSPEYNAVVYEIWCGGLSPACLPVIGSEEGTWKALLQASYHWQKLYSGWLLNAQLRRSMNPGAACDDGHWSRWIDEESLQYISSES
ncbi:hypothetical protein Hypma_004153 [Hypsizygus marmoreus]|uniref:Uncharacterized protein n=1 Tax=Hypsizygus marmoreus TaxID=39966 RepID=A0A369J2S3_HYPMA|nr:hypothetical protein Hypma_004153 [Hypsizygus marmoreus]